MSNRPYISVIIPVYRGERVVRGTVDAVQAHAAERRWPIEIVVGWSAGGDRTEDVLAAAARDYDNLVVVDTTASFGKGGAVRLGMQRASGKIRCFIDADNGVSFDQIDGAIELLEQCDVVVGSRYVGGGSAGRRTLRRIVLSRVGNILFRLILRLPFADTRAPLKVFRGEVADRLFRVSRLNGFGFDTEVLFLAQQLGYRVLEYPVRWESGGESTVSVPRDALRSLLEIAQIRWRWHRGTYRASLGPARPMNSSTSAS